MAAYIPVGAASAGREQEKAVDDMLTEKFFQTYGDVDCLSAMEVAALLHADAESRKGDRGVVADNVIYQSTKKYDDEFSLLSQPEERMAEIQDLKETLQGMVFYHPDDPEAELRLTNPEISLLINLIPEEYDEVKVFVPSLLKRKFSQQNIEEIVRVLVRKVDALTQ